MKKLFFFNFIIIIFFFFTLEILLRLFSSINELGFDENLIDLNSKIKVHNKNIESKVFGKKVFIDNYGFRVPSLNYNYDKKNSRSILILGDSVSFGAGVEEKDTFVGLLRTKNPKINFYNSSVIGQNTKDHLNLLKIYNNSIGFEEVLLIYCLNDIIDISGILTRKEFYKKNYILSKLNTYLRNKSYLYIFIKSKFTDPQKRYFDYIEPIYKNPDSFKYSNNLFEKIKEFSVEYNKKITIIILPYEYQTRKEKCLEKNLFPQLFLKSIFSKNNLEFQDLTIEFCNQSNPSKLFLKYDPGHLSEYGHNFVFNFLKSVIH